MAANERRALTTTPCVHDTTHTADDGHLLKWIRYTRRWLIFARLVRLGYNALTIDADIAVVDDAMPYLHSRHLCGRFGLMFATERVSGGLQNGVAYACGALRDGAIAHTLSEIVDRYLRYADNFVAPPATSSPSGATTNALRSSRPSSPNCATHRREPSNASSSAIQASDLPAIVLLKSP